MGTALGQDASTSGSAAPTFKDEWLELTFRSAVAVHSGTQVDSGLDLTYSGWTPNDVALRGYGWFLLDGHLGLGLELRREAFGLFDGDTRVVQGRLLSASVGPTGRLRLGPVRLEALVGYSYSEVPLFAVASPLAFGTSQRHALLASARALVDVGPVRIEGRFGYPFVLAAPGTTGKPLGSNALTVGGSVRVQVVRFGGVHLGLLADVQWLSDGAAAKDASVRLSQSVLTAGLAIDLQLRAEVAAVATQRLGGLAVTVFDAEGGQPLPGAQLHFSWGADQRDAVSDARGKASLEVLAPQDVTVRASLPGYVVAEGLGTVTAAADGTLALKLEKEKPKVGSVKVSVTEKEGKPLAGVTVDLGGTVVTTDEAGTATLEGLPPGPLAVKATLDGYLPASEGVVVVANSAAQLDLKLLSSKKREPATIIGHVRNARGGAPVAAALELPEAKLKSKASAKGSFAVKVPGGTYTVKISAPGFISQSKSVSVDDGDRTILNVDLFPK